MDRSGGKGPPSTSNQELETTGEEQERYMCNEAMGPSAYKAVYYYYYYGEIEKEIECFKEMKYCHGNKLYTIKTVN